MGRQIDGDVLPHRRTLPRIKRTASGEWIRRAALVSTVLAGTPDIARAGGAQTSVELPEIDVIAPATKDLLGVANTASQGTVLKALIDQRPDPLPDDVRFGEDKVTPKIYRFA